MRYLSVLLMMAVVLVLLLELTAVNETAMNLFRASACSALISQASPTDQTNWEAILPTPDFWDFFIGKSLIQSDILMVDADVHSWELLLNQVVGLRKTGSALADNVYAIAYDDSTCKHFANTTIHCYSNAGWVSRLKGMYTKLTGDGAQPLHVVMMGRMMTTVVALCEGHNVFLSDTDVVFYRDPIQYAFHEANIMITATAILTIPKLAEWGGTFFTDQPKQAYTLNNGVVYYRSNPVTNVFSLTLAADSLRFLNGSHDPQKGFLQKVFNLYMAKNKLSLHPCSHNKTSDPFTFRLSTTHINNTVGECYDCYYGHFPYYSDAVPLTAVSNKREALKIGVYPMKRYTSYCWAPEVFKTSVLSAALALNNSDSTGWEWGAGGNHLSRALFTHANCVDTNAFGTSRFERKMNWLRSINSWFL